MAHRYTLTAVLLAVISIPAAAQQPTQSAVPKDTSKKTVITSPGAIADPTAPAVAAPSPTVTLPAPAPMTPPAEGKVAPNEAAKVNVKVAQSLASTVKVSGDSAFAIARSAPDSGEVSSADLQMKEGRLVYQVKMLHKNKGVSEVVVDAMTGEILKDKKYGGVKAVVEHHEENKKLLDAKRDSAGTKKP
jgi:Peptidase propeptide and YPEB domain